MQELEARLRIFGGVPSGARKPGSGLYLGIKVLVERREGAGEGEYMCDRVCA